MASIWKIESVDVYIDEKQETKAVERAEIVPLSSDGSTVLQFFGSGSDEVKVQGTVFTDANKDILIGYHEDNTTITLTSDQGDEGDYKIRNIEVNRILVCSVHVPGISVDATVYRVQLDLIEI